MKIAVFFIMTVLLSYGVGQWLSQQDQLENNIKINKSSCDPVKIICNVKNNGIEYSLEFVNAPSSLTPFDVIIKMKAMQPDAIDISFDMNGMDMGYSTYHLIREGAFWKTSVILPVCSLGRNDWLINVKLKYKNKIRVTEFSFQPL